MVSLLLKLEAMEICVTVPHTRLWQIIIFRGLVLRGVHRGSVHAVLQCRQGRFIRLQLCREFQRRESTRCAPIDRVWRGTNPVTATASYSHGSNAFRADILVMA